MTARNEQREEIQRVSVGVVGTSHSAAQDPALIRALADRRIELELSDEAADWLTENGYDAVYGARPLKRLLQTAIADPLALSILDGTVRDGDTIRVIVDGDALGFTKV